MRFRDAARHFDKEPAYDGYSGTLAFKCQYSSFDDSSGDGSTNRRRGMSVAPSTLMPLRRCVQLADQRWLVGDPTDDSFQGLQVRENYNLKRVTDLMSILTPGEACIGALGATAYAQKFYFKDASNTLSDSELDTFWNIFFAKNETVSKGAFLRDTLGILYRVRQVYAVPEGFNIAQSDQLEADARQTTAVFDTGVYNSLTDSYTVVPVTVSVIQFEVPKFYRFRLQAEARVLPGDRVVFTPNTITPKAGMTFTMMSKLWQIITFQSELDGWALHVRLA